MPVRMMLRGLHVQSKAKQKGGKKAKDAEAAEADHAGTEDQENVDQNSMAAAPEGGQQAPASTQRLAQYTSLLAAFLPMLAFPMPHFFL